MMFALVLNVIKCETFFDNVRTSSYLDWKQRSFVNSVHNAI